jgi:hypothetical protein
MQYQSIGEYAGYIEYHPYTDEKDFGESRMLWLKEHMEEEGYGGELENGRVLIDFIYAAPNDKTNYRIRVALYMDGSDDGEPVFVFLRINERWTEGKTYSFHVTSKMTTNFLTTEAMKLLSLEATTVEWVNRHIQGLLEDDSMWQALPEAEA